jgi:hypothetical protein
MERSMQGLQNPLSKSNIGHMSFENRRKAYRAHDVSTTRSGMAGHMD